MKDQIKVSVVIPVYNAQSHLRQCLDSVLKQTLTALEVICVDDGSGDASLQILNEYAAQDPRVRVLTQQNQYAGAARNRGMELARGMYLAFLDADDFYLPEALEHLYRQAKKHDLDLIKGSFQYLDASTGERYRTSYSANSCINFLQRRGILSLSNSLQRLLQVPDVPWNGLYKRSFLEQNNIRFNHLRCVNDHSFYIHCLLRAKRMMVSRRMVACYRVEQADSLIGRKANHFENQLESYRIVRALCKDAEPEHAKLIMAQELGGVFSWYHRLRPTAQRPEQLDAQLSDFILALDETDVSQEFLRRFSYSADYYRLRYNAAPPARPGPIARALRCWREHGLVYTMERLMGGQERKWKV